MLASRALPCTFAWAAWLSAMAGQGTGLTHCASLGSMPFSWSSISSRRGIFPWRLANCKNVQALYSLRDLCHREGPNARSGHQGVALAKAPVAQEAPDQEEIQ